MSETIKDQDRFLEATETGMMDLREPVVESSGPARRFEGWTRRTARQPILSALVAAALGFLVALGILALGRACASKGRLG